MSNEEIIFIHIPKNGGTSIRKCLELKDRLVFPEGKTSMRPNYYEEARTFIKKKLWQRHVRWIDLHDTLKRRNSLAVIRNPWSRTVSRYLAAIKNNLINCTFNTFLEKRQNIPFGWHRVELGWQQQFDYISDENNNLTSDCIRFGYLQKDLEFYFNQKLNMPHCNNSKCQNYKNFYDSQTKKIIAEWYEQDIDLFGFTFDSDATKNTTKCR